MIDWWGLVYDSLWIAGLATILAAFSMASYQAHVEEVTLWRKLSEWAFQLTLDIGMVLFCLGLLFSSRSWWEKVIWGVATAWFALQATQFGWRKGAGD